MQQISRATLPHAKEVHAKMELANRYKKGTVTNSFFELMPTSKQERIQEYKEKHNISRWLESGKEVVAWFN